MGKGRLFIWIIIPFAVFLFIIIFSNSASATVTISNVSPANNSIHVDIIEDVNVSYVNLSWQLNDSTGGGDMEFILEVYNGSAWVVKLHQYDVSNGSWYHHWDEYPANTTNQTCYWRIHAKDGTTGEWTNETYNFRTDAKPNPPFQPTPSNGSMVEAGDITLSVNVTHPDASAGAVIHNVSFFEYPSGRIIGWNYSATGWTNGQIVKCNNTFHLEYEGTKYYWYARAMDDEYWGENSSVYYVKTYYNDTEPDVVYYSLGADIYVQPVYTESEPDIVYYSLGSQINVYYIPEFSNPSPANGTVDEWINTKLSIDAQKYGNETKWDIYFLTNNTVDGSWATIDTINDVQLGGYDVNASWYNITIDNTGLASDLTNYSLLITINDASLNLTSINHIRIYDSDKTTLLPYDVYDFSSTYFKFAVKVPHIPASSKKYIYACVNKSLTSYAGTEDAYIFWDEFNTKNESKWNWNSDWDIIYASGLWYLQSDVTGWSRPLYSKELNIPISSTQGIKILTRGVNNGGESAYDMEIRVNDSNNNTYRNAHGLGAYDRIMSDTPEDWGEADPRAFHNWEINILDGYQEIYIADVLEDTNTVSINCITSFGFNGKGDTRWHNIRVVSYASTEPSVSYTKESSELFTRKITLSTYFSGLDWNTTYYWKVGAYNSTYDRWVYSDVYHFTTRLTDPEPNITYYSIGADIYVNPPYTESEPDIVYYSLGAEIDVYNIANLSNPYPSNGSTGIWLSTPLRIDVNKTGDVMELDIIFETNYTTDGSWVEISRITQSFPPNATIQVWFSGLDWNTTYYWRVKAVNTTTGMTQYSDVYHFTTLQNDTEPNIAYYSIGADIYVEPIYTDTEPDVAYYTVGSEIPIGKPSVGDPIPENNTAYGRTDREFSVFVYDADENDTIDKIEFYWVNGTKFGEVSNFTANTRVGVNVSGLVNYTWYEWYVKVYDGNWIITSDIWRYRPANTPPAIDEDPANGSVNVAVYRKLVTGEWRRFVRLTWNISDADGDGMSFILWVKDPDTGSWIQRWTILDYSMHNGSYFHDETPFNETGQTYYWKVWVSDGKNETTEIYHFYTQFFIDFWWYPEYPTTDDVVHFYSLTEGADDFRWEFGDGTNVTGVNETTHQYLVAGYYNVTLWVYNATNNVWGSLTKTIRIDRNVTLLTPKEGEAGYNWFAWQGNETNSSHLAELLNLSKGYWIHYYNASADTWEGYFVGYNAGVNSHIKNWDATVIVVNRNITRRINVTEMYNYSLKKRTYVDTGYNVISWSSYNKTKASNLTLEDGEWVYKWDVKNRTWKAYLKGVGGDDFDVNPYDVIVAYMKHSRWWNLMFGG